MLKELFEDDYGKAFVQEKFEVKLEKALQRFNQQIEEYVKRKDIEINCAKHNMWHQPYPIFNNSPPLVGDGEYIGFDLLWVAQDYFSETERMQKPQ